MQFSYWGFEMAFKFIWQGLSVKFMGKKVFQLRTWMIFFAALLILLSFQNCGTGFKTQQSPSTLESNTGAAPPPAPAINRVPALVAPAAPAMIGMGLPAKVVVTAVDADTAQANLTFVVRSPPQSGQVVVDGGNVVQDRGFTYTPNANFIGTDFVVLSVMDPEGNLGPDTRYEIRVEQKGIGQLLGTWTRATCVPNTGPVTGSYTNTATSFLLQEIVYSVNCATPIFEHRISGLHTIGLENVALLGGVTGFEYNVTNHVSTIRPLSAAAAQAMNAQVYCGLTGWVVNVTRDISLLGCNGVWASRNLFMYRRVEYPVGQPPRMFYTDLASGGDGITPQTRTRGLALGSPFIKQ